MLNCHIRLSWNGTVVLDGKATLAVAYEAARAHMAGNFAGLEHAQWVRNGFYAFGKAQLQLERNGIWQEQFSDETGHAFVQVDLYR